MSDLQQRVLYHSIQPQSIQSVYTQNNQVDFIISVGEGRSLVPNSVRICGDLRVLSDVTDSTSRSTEGRTYEPNCGAHNFIDAVSTNFTNVGMIENLQNYPRYVNMDAVASLNTMDMLNSINQCELRGVTEEYTTDISSGVTSNLTTGTDPISDADFSIKPMICLNKMSTDNNGLPQRKSGVVRVQLTLARNADALYGSLADLNCGYELRGLRCTFKSVSDSGADEPITMGIVNSFKSNILSGAATISTNVDAIADSVSMNFIQNQHEAVNVFNSNKLENIPGLLQVEYLFNSQTNSLITFPITDQTEMLQRFIDSMEDTSHNQVCINKFRANCAFALGLPFDEPIDLRNNRFTVQIQSSVDQDVPINAFLYFHSRTQL